MKHLFPKQETRQYVLDYLAQATKGKNITFLTMAGEQGVGKGIFMSLIQKAFGDQNFIGGRQKDLEGGFNWHLTNKQFINFNEINLNSKDHMDTIKQFSEDYIQMEGKGKDALWGEIHCSCIITTNRLEDLAIDDRDRRFSVVNMTDIDVKDNEELMDKYKNPGNLKAELEEEAANFWLYLKQRDLSKFSVGTKYTDMERMKRILFKSSPDWFKTLLGFYNIEKLNHMCSLYDLKQALIEEHGVDFRGIGIHNILEKLRQWKDYFEVGGGSNRDTHIRIIGWYDGIEEEFADKSAKPKVVEVQVKKPSEIDVTSNEFLNRFPPKDIKNEK